MAPNTSQTHEAFLTRIAGKDIVVGIIGMGYVGLPLAVAFGGAGIRVLGFDVACARASGSNDRVVRA